MTFEKMTAAALALAMLGAGAAPSQASNVGTPLDFIEKFKNQFTFETQKLDEAFANYFKGINYAAYDLTQLDNGFVFQGVPIHNVPLWCSQIIYGPDSPLVEVCGG